MSPTNPETDIRARNRKAIAAREAEKRRREAAAAEKPQETLDFHYSTDSLWRYSPLEISFAVMKAEPAITGGGSPLHQPSVMARLKQGMREVPGALRQAGASMRDFGEGVDQRLETALAPVADISGGIERRMDDVASRVSSIPNPYGVGDATYSDQWKFVDDGEGGMRRERVKESLGPMAATQRILGLGSGGQRIIKPKDSIEQSRLKRLTGQEYTTERTGLLGGLDRGARKIGRLLLPGQNLAGTNPRFIDDRRRAVESRERDADMAREV